MSLRHRSADNNKQAGPGSSDVKKIYGGRGWDRTSDPYDVNVVLSR